MNTNITSIARVLGLTAALLGTALPSTAAVVVYTDQASYESALGASIASDSFNDLALGDALAGPLARQAGSTGYMARAVPLVPDLGAEDFYPVSPGSNTALSSNFANATMVFDQFSVRGLSGQFFSSVLGGVLQAGSLNLVLVDQDGSFNYNLASGIAPSFLGFISNGNISALSLSADQPVGDFSYAAVDDLGLSVTSPVPEPTAASLTLLGLGLLLVAKRRRS